MKRDILHITSQDDYSSPDKIDGIEGRASQIYSKDHLSAVYQRGGLQKKKSVREEEETLSELTRDSPLKPTQMQEFFAPSQKGSFKHKKGSLVTKQETTTSPFPFDIVQVNVPSV